MAASLSGEFNLQGFTDQGALAAGYRIYTYTAGTTTLKTAYTDAAASVPHTYTSDGLGGSYIALNSRGELPAPLYLATGAYDIALKRADGSTVWTRRAMPTDDVGSSVRADFADTTDAAKGPGLVGNNYALTYAAGTVGAALADLKTKAASAVNVFDYMTPAQIADVQSYGFTLNCSAAIFAAQTAAIAKGSAVRFPGGGYLASISLRYNKAVLLGDGAATTVIKLPASAVAITSIQVTSANPYIATITTSAAHGAWVGKDVCVQGCATASCNIPMIVTAVADATHFTAQAKAFGGVVGTYGSALLLESNVITMGACCDGNSAAPYVGSTIRGFTLDGNKTARIAAAGTRATDSQDIGLFSTAFSQHNASDLYIQNCAGQGASITINSNDGYIQAVVDSCGFSLNYPGFDVNSSSRLVLDVVSRNCYIGARLLDNCFSNSSRFAVFNSTSHGFVFQNQSGNESRSNDVVVTVESAGVHGAIIGENVRNSNIRIATYNTLGYGVVINDASVPANRVSECNFDITTRNSGQGGVLSYANRCTINHLSRLDGRTGGAGSSYALDLNGDANTINFSAFDSGTPQVRGGVIRSGATDNVFTNAYVVGTVGAANGPVDNDAGTRTRLPRTLYQAVTGLAYTVLPMDDAITFNVAGNATITLPSAATASSTREILIRTVQGFTVVSASANVVPLAGGAAGTGILAATAGKWARLKSDGTNWQIMAAN